MFRLYCLPQKYIIAFKETNLDLHVLHSFVLTLFNNLTATENQTKNIESITRDQAHSKLWFRYRAGRITVSKFKAAVHSDHLKPSLSLL